MRTPSNPEPLRSFCWRRVEPLAGDASQRRYSRVWGAEGRRAILVEYPTGVRHELERDLEVLAWCRSRGVRVPEVLAAEIGVGRALLEDLGTFDAEEALEGVSGIHRIELLDRLLEPLEILAAIDLDELPSWNPPLSRQRMRWELAGFELWFIRHHRSHRPSPDLGRWLDELAAAIARHPRRVCHRDYHLNNLLVGGGGAVGVIDIQDILVGPDTYDAVSLTAERAAVRLLQRTERADLLARWAHRTGARSGWRERVEAVRLQRGLKVLGTFARFVVAGRTEYRPWLEELAVRLAPRVEAANAPSESTALLLD